MEGQHGGSWGNGLQAASTATAKTLRWDQPALHLQTKQGGPSKRGSGLRGPSHLVPRGGGQGAGHGPG